MAKSLCDRGERAVMQTMPMDCRELTVLDFFCQTTSRDLEPIPNHELVAKVQGFDFRVTRCSGDRIIKSFSGGQQLVSCWLQHLSTTRRYCF
jgi:hypothetical protein